MSEKALKIAKQRIRQIFIRCKPELSPSQLDSLTDSIIVKIDWDNPALMHKGLKWIAQDFLNSQQFV